MFDLLFVQNENFIEKPCRKKKSYTLMCILDLRAVGSTLILKSARFHTNNVFLICSYSKIVGRRYKCIF